MYCTVLSEPLFANKVIVPRFLHFPPVQGTVQYRKPNMQTYQKATQKGLEQFLNIILFDDCETPELGSDNSYPLASVAYFGDLEEHLLNPNRSNMRHLENCISSIAFLPCTDLKDNIWSAFLESPAKSIIYKLMNSQNKAYSIQIFVPEMDDTKIKSLLLTLDIMPYQIKVFLTNQFADIFDYLDLMGGKIQKASYDDLVIRYNQPKTIDKAIANATVGVHDQITPQIVY